MGRDERANPFGAWKQPAGMSKSQTYDRNGRELGVGDVVHILGKGDIMWRVTDLHPIMDPKAPPGLIEIQLAAVFVTGVPGGQRVSDLIKCKDAREQPAGALAQGDGDPGGGVVQES